MKGLLKIFKLGSIFSLIASGVSALIGMGPVGWIILAVIVIVLILLTVLIVGWIKSNIMLLIGIPLLIIVIYLLAKMWFKRRKTSTQCNEPGNISSDKVVVNNNLNFFGTGDTEKRAQGKEVDLSKFD